MALACLALAALGPSARALDPAKDLRQCRVDSWSTKDGLPPRTVRALAQTPDGYLWLGTDGGLVRFDGVTFRVFNSLNTPGFHRDAVFSLMTDRGGSLWVGTNGSGFGRFAGGALRRYDDDGDRWSETNAICQAADGSLWVGGNGTYRLSHLTRGGLRRVWPQGIYSTASGIAQDVHGDVWATTCENGPGLVREGASGRRRVYTVKDGLPTDALKAVCRGPDGSLWVGTQDHGLCRYRGGRFTTYTTRDGLPSDWIQALSVDREGTLWVGTRDGLASLRGGRFRTFRKVDGLCDNDVRAIMEDREGDLWVAAGTGVTRIANTKLTPVTLPATAGGDARPTGMCQGADGSLWFASDLGLTRLARGRLTTFTTRDGLPGDALVSVCAGPDGTVYTLDARGGAAAFRGARATPLALEPSADIVACDRRGPMLIKWGLIQRVRAGRLVTLPTFPDPKSAFIFSCFRDRRGTVWFGSDGGLGEVLGDTTRLYHDGLPPGTKVLSVAGGDGGCLWAGTDRGLARFQDGRFTLYGVKDGLPDDNLFEVGEDDRGALWVGSDRGIFTVRVADLLAHDRRASATVPATLYSAGDGVHFFPTGYSAVKTRAGALWFMGEGGFTVVDPAHLTYNPLPPPVIIAQATANGREVAGDGGTGDLPPVRVPPGRGDLEVHFAAPSFVAPERVRFRYRLVGYDPWWVEAGGQREAHYTNLPPGRYQFQVQACNNDGVWNGRGASLLLTLSPHAYETGWFRCLAVLGTLLLAAGLYLLRTQQLRRRNRQLEAYAAERTAALVRAVEDLQRTTAQLERSHEEREAAGEELRAQNDELLATQALLEVQNDSLLTVNARLEALATTDPLTGLPNHRATMEALDAEVARAGAASQPCALLFLDIDHFKALNDAFGHPAGDAALREFARTVRSCLRATDLVGRWGGEEFVALLPGADTAGAVAAGEYIRARVEALLFPVAGGLRLTCSVGVAACPDDALDREALLAAADGAMYAAKHLGRNQVRSAGDPSVSALRAEQDASGTREETALAGVVQALLSLAEAGHPGAGAHAQTAALLAVQVAGALEMSGAEARQIGLAARLQNVGLAVVPGAVLAKPSRLAAEEWALVRRHPAAGAEILGHVPALRGLAPVIHAHHEHWDGGGYPRGLSGAAIPLGARILAVADAFAAITSPRPHRQARGRDQALAELRRGAGAQFDPDVVRALALVLGDARDAEGLRVALAASPRRG